jgi:hypothetical protein
MKLTNTIKKVYQLLERKEHLRDNDNALIMSIWWMECGKRAQDMTLFEFGTLMAKGGLTSSESIRRSRQKIQEENPHLRGKKYKFRQGKAQDELLTDLKKPI